MADETYGIRDTNKCKRRVVATSELLDLVYPIGSIYMSVNDTSPANLFGGTWQRWGSGRVPVGVQESDSDFSSAEKTGGEKKHLLTVNEIPQHTHKITMPKFSDDPQSSITTYGAKYGLCGTESAEFTSTQTGGGVSHNNMQPYITCYMWKRTA